MIDGVRQVCRHLVAIGLPEPWAGAHTHQLVGGRQTPGRSDGPIAS